VSARRSPDRPPVCCEDCTRTLAPAPGACAVLGVHEKERCNVDDDDYGSDMARGLMIFFGVPLAFFLVWMALNAGVQP
jgi:hypothetical protein